MRRKRRDFCERAWESSKTAFQTKPHRYFTQDSNLAHGEASMLAVSKHGMSHQHTDPDSTSQALLAASFDSRSPTAIFNAAASIISPLLGPCDEEAECHRHGYVTATMRHHESVVKQQREANDARFSLRDALTLPTELSIDS